MTQVNQPRARVVDLNSPLFATESPAARMIRLRREKEKREATEQQ